jgi:hypothetical protein
MGRIIEGFDGAIRYNSFGYVPVVLGNASFCCGVGCCKKCERDSA